MIKKSILVLMVSFILIWSCACSGQPATATKSPTESPSGSPSEIVPDIPLPSGTVPSQSASASSAQPSASSVSPNKPYDPSIFVIQASGKGTKELAKGYNMNYECDIYLQKIDANDNRAVAGAYQGVFWMKASLDASDYIKDLLKDAPVKASFDAGGEVISDNFGIFLNTTDDKAWVDYKILDDKGNPLPLTQDTPVAKGSFVAIAKDVFIKAKASGAQGEKVDYSKISKDQETDMNYIVHVQPDSAESNATRKVVFFITDANGAAMTVEGTMRRLPGYPEDVAKYLDSQEYRDAAQKHLGD